MLCGLSVATAGAVDIPIPLRSYLNKPGTKTKFVAKGSFVLPDPIADNPVSEGGEITVSQGMASETIALPSANWTALGNPPGSRGFKYTDASGATCKRVRVTAGSIKGLCKPTTPGAPPYDAGSDAPISIVLSIGTATQRYCGGCPNGGTQRGNPQQITKLKDCQAPATCPAPAATPTATATATAAPTWTPQLGTCCEFDVGCLVSESSFPCFQLPGGTVVGGNTICDASGTCVPPPGTPGPCCEGTIMTFAACGTFADQAGCEGDSGIFHPSAICARTIQCVDVCPSDASACTTYSGPAGPGSVCCDAVGTCATACAAAEAASCADADANASCAAEINAAGCADECCGP
jgi:hypothetical protein